MGCTSIDEISLRCTYDVKNYNETKNINDRCYVNNREVINEEIKSKIKILNNTKKEEFRKFLNNFIKFLKLNSLISFFISISHHFFKNFFIHIITCYYKYGHYFFNRYTTIAIFIKGSKSILQIFFT